MFKQLIILSMIGSAMILGPGMASEKKPEKTELTPQEKEMAHKILLLKQALPHEDILQGQIAPRLLSLATKKFQCPTEEELQKGMTADGTFEKNGIHFWNEEKQKIDLEFNAVTVIFSDDQIAKINCQYNTTVEPYRWVVMHVDFPKSGLDKSLITISPSVMNKRKGDQLYSPSDIEFTVIPFKDLPKK